MTFGKNFMRLCATYKTSIRDILLLVMAFFVSLTISQFIKLPFNNQYNISNPNNAIGYNPEGNYYMLLFLIVATLLLFILFRYLYQSKYAFLLKIIVIGTLLINYLLVQLVLTYGYTAPDGIVDSFHAGEQLSAARAFLSGVPLYGHMFFLRGAGVDAVIPALGMGLFGDSIGGFILTADSLELLAQLAFFVLLAYVIRNPILFTILAVLLYTSNATSLVQFRDITVWIAIGLLFLVFKEGLRIHWRNTALAAIGLLASVTLYISIDRGVLLVALCGLLTAVLVCVKSDKNNVYGLSLQTWKQNYIASLFVLGGLVVGISIPALLLGWGSFMEFLRMTFVDIPRYGGLLVSQPIPPLFTDQFFFWAPAFVATATAYVLYWLFKDSHTTRLNSLIPLCLIFIFAVLCLKAGSNRIHLTKMASVTAPLYLIAIVILLFAITYVIADVRVRKKVLLPTILLGGTLVVFSQLDTSRIAYTHTYTRAEFAAYKNLPKRDNNSWITSETRQVKEYIQANTNGDDKIFAFTSNPFYYYITNRQNASRFYVSWFADPQPYTNKLLDELKSTPPALVIYSDLSWMDAPDTIPMTERIPEVNDWILNMYPNRHTVGNTVILSKK